MPNSTATEELLDKLRIAQLVQNWGTWRDAGDWERLRACYTPDATMVTTWYDGAASGFVDASAQGRAKQPKDRGALHVIGATTAHVRGDRATAETRITLLLRSVVSGTLADITAYGRFFDLLVKSDGAWRIQRRTPIYDKDCIQPVTPGEKISLDPEKLAKYPAGFRHLAYAQESDGAKITLTIPDPYSDEEKAVYASGRAWLDGVSA